MPRREVPHKTKRTIGNRLTLLMERDSVTQSQLATVMGRSFQSISQIQTASRSPSLPILIALADYFRIHTDFLLGRILSQAPLENPIVIDDLKATIGKRLASLMERDDVTQYRLAKDLKLTQEAIRKVRIGINALDIQTLINLADYFKVSTDYILGRTDAPSMPQ